MKWNGSRALIRAAPNLPAVLAFALLAFQAWIPWSVSDFVTEDGPSHLYTAVVARNLLLHPHSQYATAYRFNRHIIPNWGSTIALGITSTLVGAEHAEQLFSSAALIAGFLAFAYAVRSLSPQAPRFTPVINFLLQSWFLWLGFYNFYLAMALCPLVVGYAVRYASAMTTRRAALLSAGMAALFLTHVVPAILTGIAVVLVVLWANRGSLRRALPGVLAMAPATFLFAAFALGSREPANFSGAFTRVWDVFPMHVFTTSSGRAGNQTLLYPLVLGLIVLSILAMRRSEWLSSQGALAMAAAAAFLLFLFAPDAGLGGKEAKIRFAWGVFVLGGLVLMTVRRLRPLQTPIAIYVSLLLFSNLVSTEQTSWKSNDAVGDYLEAASVIPRGATIVRLRYRTPGIPVKYGFEDIPRDPLFHLDSYVAARCGCIDLTDYQAPNNIFPVVYARGISTGQRFGLWSFEGPDENASSMLKWLRTTLPLPIDYVILVADASTPGFQGPGFQALLRELNSEMRLVNTSGDEPFVRVYQRISDR